MLVVLTTTSNNEEAEALANGLVESRLAACVQILPNMRSIYRWEGKIENESEHLLLIKTLPEKFEAVERFINENHSYDTPEVVALPAAKISLGYLNWMKDSLYNSAAEPS